MKEGLDAVDGDVSTSRTSQEFRGTPSGGLAASTFRDRDGSNYPHVPWPAGNSIRGRENYRYSVRYMARYQVQVVRSGPGTDYQ